jgi:tetratricopeptide (TPR) repeat protein
MTGRVAKTRLQEVRWALGREYTQERLAEFILRQGRQRNLPVAAKTALPVMISRWENGHDEVTEPMYRMLFREFYGRTNEELGFPPEPLDGAAEELRDRIATARSIDAATIDLFRRQIDNFRHIDRRLGAIALLDQLNSQIQQIGDLLLYGTLRQHREALAAVLAEAATLAGWEALDRASLALAWRHHETAKTAAREAGSPSLLAYATAQQAFVLIDLGDPKGAVELLDYARSLYPTGIDHLLRCWLVAAYGEGLAETGQRDAALRAFDEATSTLPTETSDPGLPYLMLNAIHLTRWRGNALAALGDKGAIADLENVLATKTPTSLRATTGALVSLAFAYSRAGDRDAAISYSRQARQLASRIGSDRQRKRLGDLRLPGGIEKNRNDRPRPK